MTLLIKLKGLPRSMSMDSFFKRRNKIFFNTQNNGVFGMFGTNNYSSNSDTQMRFGGVPYYEILVDIIVFSYDGFIVPIFNMNELIP